MSDYIHSTLEEAKAACRAYSDAVSDLQEKYGVSEEPDNSCLAPAIFAKYKTENGEVKEYYHC